jgi:CMP-N,N'-diacetyllegionaminic acid synthase
MISHKRVLALVPARAGSRGLPGKNLRRLAGKPLVSWTLEAALNSRMVDSILVSTDDEMVASIARDLGIAVLDRPPHIATGSATAAQVIAHAISSGIDCDFLAYLQPTSPLRLSSDIDAAIELSSRVGAVVSVTTAAESPLWMYHMDRQTTGLTSVIAGRQVLRRQELPETFVLNGAIYVAPVEMLRPDGDFFQTALNGYFMPPSRSVDIDDLSDFRRAEMLLLGES